MDGVLKDICIAGISTAVPKNVEKISMPVLF